MLRELAIKNQFYRLGGPPLCCALAAYTHAHPDHLSELRPRRSNRSITAAHIDGSQCGHSALIKTGQRTRSPTVIQEELAAEQAALERYEAMGDEFLN